MIRLISQSSVPEEYQREYQNPDVARRYDQDSFLTGRRRPRSVRDLISMIVTRTEQATIVDLMTDVPTGATILNVPSGSGKELDGLARRGRVIGADSSMPMLRLFVHRGGSESLCADIVSLPLKDRSVDVIVCNRFLHRLPPASRARVLAEFYRVSDHWALTYYGINGPGQRIVMFLERALRLGDRGRTFLASPAEIRGELGRSGWRVLRGRPVMTGLSTGHVFLLEKISNG